MSGTCAGTSSYWASGTYSTGGEGKRFRRSGKKFGQVCTGGKNQDNRTGIPNSFARQDLHYFRMASIAGGRHENANKCQAA